jgi:tricorn protease
MAKVPIRLASDLAVSPNGKQIAFFWKGDVWSASIKGGAARQLTRQPAWSPDGKQIAFVSEREGGKQVWVMPADGGAPRKLTLHTEGFVLEEWMPDGKGLLTSITRDHFWRHGERFSIIHARGKQEPERVLFNDYGQYPSVAPDGKRILYNREGDRWWRKGYTGSRTAQVWLWDSGDHTPSCWMVRTHAGRCGSRTQRPSIMLARAVES